jgi:hypothetical protein
MPVPVKIPPVNPTIPANVAIKIMPKAIGSPLLS